MLLSMLRSCPHGTSFVSWVDDELALHVLCCLAYPLLLLWGTAFYESRRRQQTGQQGARPVYATRTTICCGRLEGGFMTTVVVLWFPLRA